MNGSGMKAGGAGSIPLPCIPLPISVGFAFAAVVLADWALLQQIFAARQDSDVLHYKERKNEIPCSVLFELQSALFQPCREDFLTQKTRRFSQRNAKVLLRGLCVILCVLCVSPAVHFGCGAVLTPARQHADSAVRAPRVAAPPWRLGALALNSSYRKVRDSCNSSLRNVGEKFEQKATNEAGKESSFSFASVQSGCARLQLRMILVNFCELL